MSDFVDIKTVDLDVGLTQPSDKAPGLRQMYLRLSQSPPAEWIQIFDQERSLPRHSMWREAWIEGDHIVVDCVPEEIERHHLNDLKQDVASANARYREYLGQVARLQEQQHRAESAEKQRLDELRKKLDFK